jgi:acyl-CoA reductase-like NAD-dependent aldehyde dehydrogenase
MSIVDKLGLSPEFKAYVGQGPLKSFIGGQWVGSSNWETLTTRDPGSGEPIAAVYAMQAADVDRAVQSAEEAFRSSGWATMSPLERGRLLNRLADLIDENTEVLADLEAMDCGKIRSAMKPEIAFFSTRLRYYSDLAIRAAYSAEIECPDYEARTVRQPYGVCGFILPWNVPFELVGQNIAPALAAGNTVVVKAPGDTPLSTLYLGRLVEEAGIPSGVINLMAGWGEVAGSALAGHPGLKKMSFTGSAEAGRSVAAACGANLVEVKLELGGKGAAVVFEDVDVEDTARSLTGIIAQLAGQVCCTASRWLVHESIYNDFVSATIAAMEEVRIGHGFDPQTQMGPLINERQRRRVLSYIERGVAGGARLLTGGAHTVPGWEGGFYVKPTLLAGSLDNVAAQDEIFGPVAFIASFKDEAESIRLANSTPYGLANSVWSKDLERCSRVGVSLIAGTSWLNAHNIFPMGVPFSGCNRSGLGGGVNAPSTFFDYLRRLSLVRPR